MIATSRDSRAAIQARIRSTPSSTNSATKGKTAKSELQPSESATGSRTWRYIGVHLPATVPPVYGNYVLRVTPVRSLLDICQRVHGQPAQRGVEHLDGVGQGD